MAEYALAIQRKCHRFPTQWVLYIGNAPLSMPTRIDEPRFPFSYQLLDLRTVPGEALLADPQLEANLLSLLTQLPDQQAAIRQILTRISQLAEAEQRTALQQLGVVADLRHLGHT